MVGKFEKKHKKIKVLPRSADKIIGEVLTEPKAVTRDGKIN